MRISMPAAHLLTVTLLPGIPAWAGDIEQNSLDMRFVSIP